MRLIRGLCVVTLLVSASAFAQGDSAPPTADAAAAMPADPFQQPAADDPVHDELRALQAAMEDALNTGNLDALLEHVDDTVVFTAMNAEAGYGKEGIREYFDRMMKGPKKVVENIKVDFVPDQLAVFYGPDVALSAGRADSHYELTSGMKFDVAARYTVSMARRGGRWLVTSAHYSTNMFKNPVLDAQRKVLITAGAAATVIVGLIAFFLGRRNRRKPA